MNRDCKTAQNWISDYARGSGEIPEPVLRHIERCEDCARAVAELHKLTALLVDTDRVPQTPDCRGIVLSRISPQPARRRFVFACALACVALAIALGVGCLVHRSEPPLVRRQTLAIAKPPSPNARPKGATRPPEMVKPTPRPPKSPETAAPRSRRAPRRYFAVKPKPTTPEPQRVAVLLAPAPQAQPQERPVALVVATWQAPGEPDQDQDYSYTRNEEDGSVTRCTVTRSGDSIVVNMQTQTPADEEAPVKGSVDDHDNKIDV